MTEDPPKKDEDQNGVDDAFQVKIPDELLEDAVEAVDRRVAEAKAEDAAGEMDVTEGFDVEAGASMELGADGGEEIAVETTQPEGVDIENMSIDDLLASGLLPEKVTTAINTLRAEANEARAEARDAREKLAAASSEAENFRRRVTREKNEALKFASEAVLKEVLPVFDNLERALAHSDATTSQATVRDGVEITLRQFWHILQRLGVTKVGSEKGTPFDPHVHEAVAQEETAELAPNSVAVILQTGFMLHDRLLRPAMVSVAKAPPAAPNPAPVAAAPAPAAEPAVKAETAEEKLERIRKAGAAAREARQKKREERTAAAPAAAAPKETAEEKLERIRKAGAAARDARQKKREERAAVEAAPAAAPTKTETPEEKLERVRKAGAAAREARQKKRDERAAAAPAMASAPAPTPPPATPTAAAPTTAAAPVAAAGTDKQPLAPPSFEDDDLSEWESTVDSARTDKNARR